MGGLRTLAFLERGVASLVKQPPNPQRGNTSIFFTSISPNPQRGNTSIFFTSISPNPQRGLNLQYLTGDSRSESSRVYYHNILSAKPIPVLFILGACAARVLRVRTAIFTSPIYHFNQLIEK